MSVLSENYTLNNMSIEPNEQSKQQGADKQLTIDQGKSICKARNYSRLTRFVIIVHRL